MIYTIGHSIQSIDEFYNMINAFNIDCVIDVRSTPFSQHAPQFNKDNLKFYLKTRGVLYAHFGLEFGARRNDCLATTIKDDKEVKQVNFELGVKTDNFRDGIRRLDNALGQDRTIALMCTESNPLDCHRFSFISRYLYDNGYDVSHITRNKATKEIELKSHKELEVRMIKEYLSKKSPELKEVGRTLFDEYSEEEQRIDAYRLKNRDIGFIPSMEEQEIID